MRDEKTTTFLFPRTQARFPRIETGNVDRPSGPDAGAVPVARQSKRALETSHISKNMRGSIRGATRLPQGRLEGKVSPSETDLLAPCAVEGHSHEPRPKTRRSRVQRRWPEQSEGYLVFGRGL